MKAVANSCHVEDRPETKGSGRPGFIIQNWFELCVTLKVKEWVRLTYVFMGYKGG